MSKVSVSMDEKTLHRLMSSGALCVADFKCLDCDSKACVWRIALENAGQAQQNTNLQLERMQAKIEACLTYVKKTSINKC